MTIRSLCIVYDPTKETATRMAGELVEWLRPRNLTVQLCSTMESEKIKAHADDSDLILCLGGDGTVLRVVQDIVPATTLITAVNFGKLGFMCKVAPEGIKESLNALLQGEGWIHERAMLQATIHNTASVFHALNDIVVAGTSVTRDVQLKTSVNNEHLTTYMANGLIMATATGSTAYSLAAGGPILEPHAREFILQPLLPARGIAYPLVLPANATVGMQVICDHDVTLTVDGHRHTAVSTGTSISVQLSKVTVRFLGIGPEHFYGTLEERLQGKHHPVDNGV